MSLPARDRLARALDRIHGETLRLAEAKCAVHQSAEPYPLRLGTLLGHTAHATDALDHYIAAAREALAEMSDGDDDAAEVAS